MLLDLPQRSRVLVRMKLGVLLMLLVASLGIKSWAADAALQPLPALPQPGTLASPLSPLGPGDTVTVHVYGQPDDGGALAVAEDGTLHIPLAGSVQVGGLSPDEAARRIEKAYQDGRFYIDPHVTLTVIQSLSQRVSVLGEVRTPGRYPVDSRTTILDLLAEAGGVTELGSDTIFILRQEPSGEIKRYPVNLKGLADPRGSAPTQQLLRAADSVYVPQAEQFFIMGEVQKPSMYKLEHNMTVMQAISLAGGLTAKGSNRRIEIKRTGNDGNPVVLKVKGDELVQPRDVIRVKESIF